MTDTKKSKAETCLEHHHWMVSMIAQACVLADFLRPGDPTVWLRIIQAAMFGSLLGAMLRIGGPAEASEKRWICVIEYPEGDKRSITAESAEKVALKAWEKILRKEAAHVGMSPLEDKFQADPISALEDFCNDTFFDIWIIEED